MLSQYQLDPSHWFDRDAALCTANAGLPPTSRTQRKHWSGHCKKWYRCAPLRSATWNMDEHGPWMDMNGCIGLGKPWKTLQAMLYFLPNITQLWLWWMFLVGFPSTKRAWWRSLPVEILERKLSSKRPNCPVRASLSQGHLYQQELCHLPLVSSVQTSLSKT